MPASNGRRFALEISADLNRLATDRKHSQAKANAQSDDDDLAAAVAYRTKCVSTLGVSAQVDAPFSAV